LPEQIAAIGKLVFDRRLTDIAGGNISARQGDSIFITPTRAGQKYYWNLSADLIICAPVASDELLANPQHSKESISHLMVYRAFPEVNAIIHAHPFHLMPFLAKCQAPRPLILPARLYGELEFIPDLPLYSAEQGQAMVKLLSARRELMARLAAAILMPFHGIFIAGKDLDACVDCLERIDNSAYTNLATHLLE
jgi:L-fuculose-phosphate aldolase